MEQPMNVDPTFDVEGGLELVNQTVIMWRNVHGHLVNWAGERIDASGRLTRARSAPGQGSQQRRDARHRWPR